MNKFSGWKLVSNFQIFPAQYLEIAIADHGIRLVAILDLLNLGGAA